MSAVSNRCGVALIGAGLLRLEWGRLLPDVTRRPTLGPQLYVHGESLARPFAVGTGQERREHELKIYTFEVFF